MDEEEQMEYQIAYRLVARRAMKKNYTKKLLIFTAVNAGLVYLDFKKSKGKHWSLYAMAGWGLGLLTSYQLEKNGFENSMKKKESKTEKLLKKINR